MHLEPRIHASSTFHYFFLMPPHAVASAYALLLVPIACSVALLFAAQRLCARFEV